MSTVRLTLVRHGQSLWNAQHKMCGWSDIPLSALGRDQAREVGRLLGGRVFDRVWSSDLGRAIETARLAVGEPVLDARLREMNFGDLDGCTWEQMPAWHARDLMEFVSFSAPGGESVIGVRARVVDFVAELAAGEHAVFCHGGVIRVLLHELGAPQFVPNCAVVEIDWTQRQLLGIRAP